MKEEKKIFPVILRGRVTKITAFRVPGNLCLYGMRYSADIKKNRAEFWLDKNGEYKPMAEAKRPHGYGYSLLKFYHPGWCEGDTFHCEGTPERFTLIREKP